MKDRKALIQCSEFRSYRRNDLVIEAGEWTDRMYCVTSGLLRVVARCNASSADVTTDFIQGGDLFHGPLLSGDRYQAAAALIAALPSSVYLVPVAAVRELCSTHPEMALGLVDLSMGRLASLRRQLGRISSLSAEVLVGHVLHELTQLAPVRSGGYDKRITQAVIASYSGLSRGVVNKTMRDLESRGVIRREGQGIHVSPDLASTGLERLLQATDESSIEDARRRAASQQPDPSKSNN
ncbi:CRP-like cAMP-binding protein [Variovorax boronicumulans]|uniref:CRP-like cAMP-binding protein n=1 Tax=Variovorax boronicumulans TaxID=436515 RepID=A0AAW8D061_9BURK|nr:Crp/Fnr family transcriptional regulator [Variovorax boronicumulans]MDP9894861.1 CRP-like cAMP-binding protein [Variovorax boronicumulans]MDQ0054819.1 CRP-like cAMP-binding protein [Variovorax boronicumulans]